MPLMYPFPQLKKLLSKAEKYFSIKSIKSYCKNFILHFWYLLKQGSIKNILSISGIAKLAFLYFSLVFYIIIFDFEFSRDAFTKNAPHKIALYSVKGRIGEHMSYVRTLRALKTMNWSYVSCSFDEGMISDPWTSHLYYIAASIVNIIVKPEFNLALTHYVKIVPVGYNVTYLNMPDLSLYSLKHRFKPEYPHLARYDAYIDLATLALGHNPLLQKVLQNYDRPNALVIPAYLAQDYEEYMPAKKYKTAVITGSLWGCNRGSFRFKDAIYNLSKEKLLVAYGLAESFDYLEEGYLGEVEENGDPYGHTVDKLLELQNAKGIALIVHNFEHLVQGLPTSRVAEGIMAGAVLISDQHEFIQKHFGDNVLYFNSFGTSEEIYNQIKAHIEWIRAHPIEASRMAKSAYDIFIKDWTLEVQLQKVIDMIYNSTNPSESQTKPLLSF